MNTIEHEVVYEDLTDTSAGSLYLMEIRKYPVLSPCEEQELAQKMASGDKLAKKKFIESNLRLVSFVVNSILNKSPTINVDYEDLIQEGNLALLKAIDAFDYTKGFKFSTFATKSIKLKLLRFINNQKNPIRIPIYMQKLIRDYETKKNEFYKENSRYPSDEEIAREMQISLEKVQEIKSSIYKTISLNLPISAEIDSDELGDFIEDENSETPEEWIINMSQTECLDMLISNSYLTAMEEKVIRKRFDLSNQKITSLGAVAKELGVTQARVRLMESRALKKIRHVAWLQKDSFM